MPANPDYDPHWRARHCEASEALARAEAERTRAAATHFGGAGHQHAVALCTQARQALDAAWVAQFPTIAAYAAWRFSTLPHADFTVVQDHAAFATCGEVDMAFARARRNAEEGLAAEIYLLRTAQPPGLAAFAGDVVSTTRRFGEIDLLVSFHETPPSYHVCLAHRWGELRGSNETFRACASQLMRESILVLLPEAEPLFSAGRHHLVQHRDLLRQANALAARFHYYRHLQPGARQREEFTRVEMAWAGTHFIDPEWSAEVFATLPPTLREATAQMPSAPLQLKAE